MAVDEDGRDMLAGASDPSAVPNIPLRMYAATANSYFQGRSRYSVDLKAAPYFDDSPSRSFHSICSATAPAQMVSFMSALSSKAVTNDHSPSSSWLFMQRPSILSTGSESVLSVSRGANFISCRGNSASLSRLSLVLPPQRVPLPAACLVIKEKAWQVSTHEIFDNLIEASEEFTIWCKEKECPDGDGSMPCVKLVCHISGVSADAVFEALSDKDWIGTWHEDVECARAYAWDEFDFPPAAEPTPLPGQEYIDSKVWLTQYRMPTFAKVAKTLGFKPREVAELRLRCRNIFSKPGMHIIAGSSIPVAHRLDRVPCTPGYERAHLFISCQLMQQTENGTQLTMVSHVDPNGVPRWVLNKIAHRKPREFCAALKEQLYKRRRTE
ncbi:hypothetical protein FOL46_004026 [Perkinsus olseni]|uniref:START domain-containing protein n=1 Tax=Perkinsus olseni TaxID=32597 RepID=A0A7J6MTL4_PEROL|nr:hypothetical protein FOL46_004026 [Perkinsus olseni]